MFEHHDGLARRQDLLAAGVSIGQIRGAVGRGEWVIVGRGLYGLVSWGTSFKRDLLAACLATGGVASHSSAAWLWGLLEKPTAEPTVTVAHGQRPLRKGACKSIAGATRPVGPAGVRRMVRAYTSTDLVEASISHWQGIPTTNPLRTLVDLAGEVPAEVVDAAMDRALARGLVTVEGLVAEVERLGRRGRRGPHQLRLALVRRGFVGAPKASVLESKLLRLFAANEVDVISTEVVTADGRYRIDAQVQGDVFVEVDGYAFHWSPEQKERDEARRNALRLMGYSVLVYGWRAVTKEGHRVVQEVLYAQALTRR